MEENFKIKRWSVVRVVEEQYEIEATTKEEALFNLDDPHTITVKKETIKEVKD